MPQLTDNELARALRSGLPAGGVGLRLGIDTVQVSAVEASLLAFGDRFLQRLFTAGEIATCAATPARCPERLAARFAAKEAAIKAFDLAEAGVDWRQIEVVSDAAGRPRLALHGRAAALVRSLGAAEIALSLSHDGDQACAVVAALPSIAPTPHHDFND